MDIKIQLTVNMCNEIYVSGYIKGRKVSLKSSTDKYEVIS